MPADANTMNVGRAVSTVHRSALAASLAFMAGLFPRVWAVDDDFRREVTYVANVENGTVPNVRFTGREWTPQDAGFLSGRGPGHQILMIPPPGEGDFSVEARFDLPIKGKKSAVTIGYDSRIVFRSGSDVVMLEGRFFRAGEKPIEVRAGSSAPGTINMDRKDGRIEIRIGGRSIFEGPCDPGPLSMLGIDPMEGTVQLNAMSAQGNFPVGDEREFGNPFGMQLRKAPASAAEVFAPVIVRPGPTNECALVGRRDGTLELYHATKPASDSISVTRSKDGGLTWTPSEIAFPLSGKIYYAVMAMEGSDGEVHLVFHLAGQGPGGYRGRLYNVYYTRTNHGKWETPKLVVPGYVGSIRGLIQLRSGRILLSVGRADPDRTDPPPSGTDYGWNDVATYFSDDNGGTWKASEDVLKLPLEGQNVTRYGAIEPALVELENGVVWMLIRSRDGRFWESHSDDGSRWSQPRPTTIITSDSPASLIKLEDKRLVLLANACQNWTNPRSYAMGGREVLQASISSDDGKTWRGFRDVLHETLGPAGGDRGTAYASGVETRDGKICFFGGQGEGKRAVVLFDPDWLEENKIRDDLANGPTGWAQYGDDGIQVETVKGEGEAVMLPLKSSGLCGASWNFPAAKSGEITFRVWTPKEARSLCLALTDHFSRMDDAEAAENSVFRIPLEGPTALPTDQWSELNLRWNSDSVELVANGRPLAAFSAAKSSASGVNYLRIEAKSAVDRGALKVLGLAAIKK